MSGRDDLAAIINAHAVAGIGPSSTACGCDRRWRPSKEYDTHLADAIIAAGWTAPAAPVEPISDRRLAEAVALHTVRDLWHAARDDRDDAIALMSELLSKTPSAGEDEHGFIRGYILPTGPLHRIAAYLTAHGQSFPKARSWAEVKAEPVEPSAVEVEAVLSEHESCDYVIADHLGAAFECGILVEESPPSLAVLRRRHMTIALLAARKVTPAQATTEGSQS